MRTWMYISGVFYPATFFDKNLPSGLGKIAEANPAVVYLDLMRYLLIHDKSMQLLWGRTGTMVLAVGWAIVMSVVGFIYFWRGEGEYGRG